MFVRFLLKSVTLSLVLEYKYTKN